MIIKEITSSYSNALENQGKESEKQMAFYLNHSFKSNNKVFVFNELMIEYDNEIAQIDHLIVFKNGVFIIESKSCLGEISYNEKDEWQRKTKTYHSGFKSPIKQAKRQMEILSSLITHHAKDIFRSNLFIKAENVVFSDKNFGKEILVAIDDKAILKRENNTKINDTYVMKADAICDYMKKRLDRYDFKWTSFESKEEDNKITMKEETLNKMCNFLLEIDEKTRSRKINFSAEIETKIKNNEKSCKSCGKTDNLEIKYGKYGYYFFCNHCNKNSNIKEKCPDCSNTKTKIKKFKNNFYLDCGCGNNSLYHQNK